MGEGRVRTTTTKKITGGEGSQLLDKLDDSSPPNPRKQWGARTGGEGKGGEEMGKRDPPC